MAIIGVLAAVAKTNAKAAFDTDSAYSAVTAALHPPYVQHAERR